MMADSDRPQIYLVTPPVVDLGVFPDRLARVLDAHAVACVRLALAGGDEYDLGRAADALRAVAHERDVAIVIDTHLALAERHGLDGVHLLDSARSVRSARKALGADAIVGAYCGASRDAGLSAGEAGADYVAFGPAGETALGPGRRADLDLFTWWSEMVEVPVVAEGALTPGLVRSLAPVADFIALGDEIWAAPDPAAALGAFLVAMG
jgi:thiamine-phosphate pyrophosphorylase